LVDQKISLVLSPEAMNYIAEVGYDPVYGARPLKRAIQRELENPIANLLLEQKYVAGDTIYIDRLEEGLSFTSQPKSSEKEEKLPSQLTAISTTIQPEA
ncbi:C-terminal, D2-small domain, of ClpB family protein, partial [Lyngbya aestuarii BL J]